MRRKICCNSSAPAELPVGSAWRKTWLGSRFFSGDFFFFFFLFSNYTKLNVSYETFVTLLTSNTTVKKCISLKLKINFTWLREWNFEQLISRFFQIQMRWRSQLEFTKKHILLLTVFFNYVTSWFVESHMSLLISSNALFWDVLIKYFIKIYF